MKRYYLQAKGSNDPIYVAERSLELTTAMPRLTFTSFPDYARLYDERDLPREAPKKFFKVLAKSYLDLNLEFEFVETQPKENHGT